MHGREAAARAAEAARQTFEDGLAGEDLPSVTIPAAELAAGLGVLSAFVRAGLVPSTGEARRQIQGGGLRLNDVVLADPRANLTAADFGPGGAAKLSLGRKKHVLLRAV